MAGAVLIPRRRAAWLFTALTGLASAAAQADSAPTQAFYTSNQSPLIAVHNLPAIDTADILAAGETRQRFVLDQASNYVSKSSADESVLLDGETTRLTYHYSRGLANGWEWGVAIPLVSHQRGFLDDTIIRWHDLFGLPQGGRESAPDDRLLYRYRRDGVTQLELSDSGTSIGDLRLTAGWQWRGGDQASPRLALRGALALPTGDADQLRGSGGVSAALWLSAAHTTTLLGIPAGLFGGGGGLWLAEGEVLPDQQNSGVLFGTAGIGMAVSPRFVLKLQADMHTPVYAHSSLVALSANALQVVFGADVVTGPDSVWGFAVSEDPTVGASPDVVFHLEFCLRH